MDSKRTILLGRFAMLLSILMYVSYVPQIINNLSGNYGNPIQPLFAAGNCILWCLYSLLKKYKDWPIFLANLPGIALALIAFITSVH
ncbi:SemiSWEET family transporter [Companilactobacillus sp. FL22-1]|uniref:SemiSWEET family transporter n=1 Tax=Companilactobacillus sp. FL22-1 TaxID=3373892 RepID=UPI0037542306